MGCFLPPTPAVLEPVEAGLVGDAQREVGAAALQRGDRARGVKARTGALRLGGVLDADPQDRAHAQVAHGVGERVQVGDVVGAVPGPVVVHAGVHRHAELGEHRAAGVPAQRFSKLVTQSASVGWVSPPRV